MNLLDDKIFDIPLYTLKDIICDGRITEVYDGDTITVVLQINECYEKHKIRLIGINAPEIKGNTHIKGVEARNFLISLIVDDDIDLMKEYTKKEIINMLITTKKIFRFELLGQEKYGRQLARIYDDKENCLNDLMLFHGYAIQFMVD